MILVRTPFRISFIGGGSDFYNFYRNTPGAVISTSIDKYMYISINKKFDGKIRVNYSTTEEVAHNEDVNHPLVRESLILSGISSGIEISSQADIPSKGSGLGSSSSYTVGLINGLSAYLNKSISASDIANLACEVEIKKCNEPIGKQDQYAASIGGLNLLKFNSDETVEVDPFTNQEAIDSLQDSMLIFYTGKVRSASTILKEQNMNLQASKYQDHVKKMVELVYLFKAALSNNDIRLCGQLIDESWSLKKLLSSNISNELIDNAYRLAKNNGAYGGKILGAGYGGFLMIIADKVDHNRIKKALDYLTSYSFKFENSGSTIVYNDN